MTQVNYPLASPSWGKEEYEALDRVISSGNFSMGKEVLSFEHQFADYFGGKHAIMLNSGSSANLIMIAALFFKKENPLQKGDEVIVPAVSWSTTYMPLQQYGLKVKFVDIDLQTLNFDLSALSEAITDKTKIIFAVNLLGNPNDFDKINSLIEGKNIILLEDNCESMGATYKNKQAGSFGLMGSFSSFFSHHMSTMEGGMVITDDEELYHIMLSLRAHGWTRNLPQTNWVTGNKSDDPFEESFKFVLPGYNLRPLEMSGALGKVQLEKLNGFIKQRKKNAETFYQIIKEFPFIIPQKEIGESSYFGFSMILDEKYNISKNDLIKTLTDNGIETRPIVGGNFTKNEVIKYFDYEIHGHLHNAELIDRSGLFIGNHHYDLTKELNLFKDSLHKLFH